jgi:CBS domain-containing protein
MKTAIDILHAKSIQTVYSVPPDAFAREAVRLLAELNIGALVVAEAGRIVGVLSERDFVRRLGVHGVIPPDLRVSELMTSKVLYAQPTMTNEECMAVMTDNRLRHLPVVDATGRLLGVVSIGDLIKDIISEQKYVIEQLEHYIAGALA